MPIQAPQWTEFLSCPVCCHDFDVAIRGPISLGCGHTICRTCLANLHRKQCPFDQVRNDAFTANKKEQVAFTNFTKKNQELKKKIKLPLTNQYHRAITTNHITIGYLFLKKNIYIFHVQLIFFL